MSIGPVQSVIALSFDAVAQLKAKQNSMESAAKALNSSHKTSAGNEKTSHKVQFLTSHRASVAAAAATPVVAAVPLTALNAEADQKQSAEIQKKLDVIYKQLLDVFRNIDQFQLQKDALSISNKSSSQTDSQEVSSQNEITELPRISAQQKEIIEKAEKEVSDLKLIRIEKNLKKLHKLRLDLENQRDSLYGDWDPILRRISIWESQHQVSSITVPSVNASKLQLGSGKAVATESAAAAKKGTSGLSLHLSQTFSQFST